MEKEKGIGIRRKRRTNAKASEQTTHTVVLLRAVCLRFGSGGGGSRGGSSSRSRGSCSGGFVVCCQLFGRGMQRRGTDFGDAFQQHSNTTHSSSAQQRSGECEASEVVDKRRNDKTRSLP
jgi:hypothetical protein